MVISNDKWRDLQSERTQKFSDSECCDARGLYTGTMSMVPSGQDFRDIYAILWISVCIIFSWVQLQRSEGLPIGYVFFLDLRVRKFSVNSILQKEPEKNQDLETTKSCSIPPQESLAASLSSHKASMFSSGTSAIYLIYMFLMSLPHAWCCRIQVSSRPPRGPSQAHVETWQTLSKLLASTAGPRRVSLGCQEAGQQ